MNLTPLCARRFGPGHSAGRQVPRPHPYRPVSRWPQRPGPGERSGRRLASVETPTRAPRLADREHVGERRDGRREQVGLPSGSGFVPPSEHQASQIQRIRIFLRQPLVQQLRLEIRAANTMSRICCTISLCGLSRNVRLWTNPSGIAPGPAHPLTTLVAYL